MEINEYKQHLTIKDISKFTEDMVLDFVDKKVPHVNYDGESRINLTRFLYNVMGYDLTPDSLLVMANECPELLILAPAGAGKTSSTQLKIALEKIVRDKTYDNVPIEGNRVLCLVYNTSNVGDMERTQQKIVRKIYESNVDGIDIDNKIYATTFHSFCLNWLNEYGSQSPIAGKQILRQFERVKMMSDIFRVFDKKFNLGEGHSMQDMLKLYDMSKERLVDYNDIDTLDLFDSISIDKDIVVKLLKAYDNKKSCATRLAPNGYIDFIDYLVEFLKFAEENAWFRDRIKNYYDYIVADEVQDFTPLMWKILRVIKGEEVPLVCIGDEDQCIYSFKGADIKSLLKFKEYFPNGQIHSLSINRRCPKIVVDCATNVVNENTLRFNKTVYANKDKGEVVLRPYLTNEGQIINIIKELEKMQEDEFMETVIAFRKGKDLLLTSTILEKNGIPFNSICGEEQSKYLPFKHELYKHYFDILYLLFSPNDRDYHKNLYKVLPLSKAQVYECIGFDGKKNKFQDGFYEPKNYWEIDFSKYIKGDNSQVTHIINLLKEVSLTCEKTPMRDYIPGVYNLLYRYFWKYKSEILSNDVETDAYFSDVCFNYFNSEDSFQRFLQTHYLRTEILNSNQSSSSGVTLSTFHKLKGLEYDNVYLINLDNEEFPNFEGIDSLDISNERKLELRESETRLAYVAMTRAKKKLCLYYNEKNPSHYISKVKEVLEGKVDVHSGISNQISIDTNILEESKSTKSRFNTSHQSLLEDVKEELENTNQDLDGLEDNFMELDTLNGQQIKIKNEVSITEDDDDEDDEDEELLVSISENYIEERNEDIEEDEDEDDEEEDIIENENNKDVQEEEKQVEEKNSNSEEIYDPIDFLDSLF